MAKGQQVAKPDTTPPTRRTSAVPAVTGWLGSLEVEASLRDDDETFDADEILGRILTAATWEDALAVQESGLPSGKDLVDVPLIIEDFEVAESEKEGGVGFFLFVNATNLETGEEVQFSVGAGNVMAILWQARTFEKLPGSFIIKGKQSKKGNEVLMLHPYKATVVKG
jgi:hypothetical protein